MMSKEKELEEKLKTLELRVSNLEESTIKVLTEILHELRKSQNSTKKHRVVITDTSQTKH